MVWKKVVEVTDDMSHIEISNRKRKKASPSNTIH